MNNYRIDANRNRPFGIGEGIHYKQLLISNGGAWPINFNSYYPDKVKALVLEGAVVT